MESDWRENVYETGNVGYYSDGSVFRDYHCTLVAQLDPPITMFPFTFDHLLRYRYPNGFITMWGTALLSGWVAPWGFAMLPRQTGPFPHGYTVLPDT